MELDEELVSIEDHEELNMTPPDILIRCGERVKKEIHDMTSIVTVILDIKLYINIYFFRDLSLLFIKESKMIVEKQKCQTKFQTLYKNVRKSTEDLLHFVREFESDSDSLAEAIGANLSQVSLTIFLLSRANLPSEDVLTLYTQGRLSFIIIIPKCHFFHIYVYVITNNADLNVSLP